MSIERSTELLRLALPWMSRQAAALHPVSYAVWFDYVARTNAPLRAAVDEHLAREGSLDEFATHALFKRHVADVDPDTAQHVVDGMQRVLGGIGDAAGTAGAQARHFGASLAQLAAALERGDTARGMQADADPASIVRNGPPPRQLADVVAEVIADTGAMRSHIGGLQQRLADSRREIERLRAEVRRAREEALRDSLTGLANRRAFDQALTDCLRGADRPRPSVPARGAPPADAASDATRGPWLLLSDVDDFERIGADYGAAFGDQVLKAVADALASLAPAGATLARVGGESFALLVPELDADGADALAQRLGARIGSARIRRPGAEADAQAEPARITLSLGLAPHRTGEPAAALLERADAALRQARDQGPGRIVSAG